MSSNLRCRKREARGVRGPLFILKQYCYKILVKATTIIECKNRTHPTRINLLLEMLIFKDYLSRPPWIFRNGWTRQWGVTAL
jgi:hypothetical protein